MKKRNAASPALGLSFKTRLFFTNMLALNSALFMGAMVVPVSVYAAGENDSIAFSIPAGDLQKGLLAIASQSKQTLSFNPALVANYQSAELNGNYSTRQAILRLLQGTPLLLTTTDNGTLTIVSSHANDAEVAQASDKTLPAITVSAGSEDATVLNPGTSSSALRANTSLQQTAQSVQVISNKLIAERQAASLEDALKNSAGTVAVRTNRGTTDYWIRGYQVSQGLTDGVSGGSSANMMSVGQGTAIDGIERVEVLKGPQSVLAGSSSPAGTINVVRKKPVTDPLHVIKVEAARYGEFKTAIDLGGALTDDKSLSYRLNASSMKSDNAFPDFNGNHNDYLAPAFTWQGDSTRVTAGAEFNQLRDSGPAGTIYDKGKIQKLSVYRLGDKDDHFKTNTKSAWWEAEQELIDGWTFNSKANFQSAASSIKMHELQFRGFLASSPTSVKYTNQVWSLQNDVRGEVETGPVKQTLLLGHDYQHSRYASYDMSQSNASIVDIYNPDRPNLPGIGDPDFQVQTNKLIQSGFLLQDQIDVYERLHFQLSLKYSRWNSTYQSVARNEAPVSYRVDKWVPNYGISFDITPDVTVYANYLNSFSGNAQINPNTGEVFDPSTGKSKELGLKLNLLDDNLTLTTALFEIKQNNIVVWNSNGRVEGVEGRASKGFDVDLTGTLLPGWEVAGGYTWQKNDDSEESKPRDFARHTGSLWTSYEIQSGKLQGAGASIGISGASKNTKSGYSYETFNVAGWTQTDIAVFYRQPDWSVQLGVNNVFDRDIYYSSSSPWYIGVKEGRTWRLTGTYSF